MIYLRHVPSHLRMSTPQRVLAIAVCMLFPLSLFSHPANQPQPVSSQQGETATTPAVSYQPGKPATQLCAATDSLRSADTAVSNSVRFRFQFPFNSAFLRRSLGNNAQQEDSLRNLLARINGNPLLKLDSVRVWGSASPDGAQNYNMQLSEARRAVLARFATNSCNVPRNLITYAPCPTPAEAMAQFLAKLPTNEQKPDSDMRSKIYPLLRCAVMDVNFKNIPPPVQACS